LNDAIYFPEAAKSQQLTKFCISLIRQHFDPSSETAFLETAREVAKYFRQIGKDDLATFIECEDGDCKDVWVPM